MTKQNIIAVIPARMNSSRFPGKPMELIHGIPMIGHCFLRVKLCPDLDDTYVATCDPVIYDYIRSIGGKVIMTSEKHERASDRTAEAISVVERETKQKVDIVVMVQGDEPMDTPEMISEALAPMLRSKDISVVNLMGEISSVEEFEDPNTVKVVVDNKQSALYFSREPVPSRREGIDSVPMLKQICIIPFRRDYLTVFNNTTPTPLEVIESVDMLRVLESGGLVQMVRTESESYGVDTPEDLELVTRKMENDPLMRSYLGVRR